MYIDAMLFIFFFNQKTAYEMRISDWSSDVCSSDLLEDELGPLDARLRLLRRLLLRLHARCSLGHALRGRALLHVVVVAEEVHEIGRASCRERVCQYV